MMRHVHSLLLKSLQPAAALTRLALALAAGIALAAQVVQAAPFQSHDSIRHAARAFLTGQTRGTGRDIAVAVDHLDPRLRVPRCGKPLAAFLPPGNRPLNTTTVGVRCSGATPWTLYVPAHVTAYAHVVIALRPLIRGHRVAAADIALRRRDTARLPMGYVTDPQQVVGQLVQRPIPMDAAIDPTALARPSLVHRGQQVTIVARSGALEVRMVGKALGDGARGEQVRVRNMTSREVVTGVVSAKGTINVQL